jgi:hypothetical protein
LQPRRIHIRSISQILKLKNDQVRLKMLEQECRKLELKLRLCEAGQADNDDGQNDDRENVEGENDDRESVGTVAQSTVDFSSWPDQSGAVSRLSRSIEWVETVRNKGTQSLLADRDSMGLAQGADDGWL